MTEIIPHSSSSSDVKKSFHGFLANLSELTAKEYARATGEFLNFVAKDDVRHPSELKKHHLVLFRRELERNGLAKKMSLVATANKAGANLFDYFCKLQQHHALVKQNPEQWLPWNYLDTIDLKEIAA